MIKCILFLCCVIAPLQVHMRFIMPAPGNAALMARYVVYKSAWTSISTISTLEKVKSYPFVNLKSISDGDGNQSTGIIYMYLTPFDLTGKDIKLDNRVSVVVTLAQSDYCVSKNLDQQDPRCARVMITGRIVKIDKSSKEYQIGETALFSRHPEMKNWPADHDFYVTKVDIEQVLLLDSFGGVKQVSVQDYYNANPNQ